MAKGRVRKTSSFSRSKGRATRREGSPGSTYVAKRLRVVDVDQLLEHSVQEDGLTPEQARAELARQFSAGLLRTDADGVTRRTL